MSDEAAAGAAELVFRSPEVAAQKASICDIGRRLWQRAYVDGNRRTCASSTWTACSARGRSAPPARS